MRLPIAYRAPRGPQRAHSGPTALSKVYVLPRNLVRHHLEQLVAAGIVRSERRQWRQLPGGSESARRNFCSVAPPLADARVFTRCRTTIRLPNKCPTTPCAALDGFRLLRYNIRPAHATSPGEVGSVTTAYQGRNFA